MVVRIHKSMSSSAGAEVTLSIHHLRILFRQRFRFHPRKGSVFPRLQFGVRVMRVAYLNTFSHHSRQSSSHPSSFAIIVFDMSESHASRYRPLLPGPTRGDLPGAPPPRIATRKRSVVKTACGACRQRRVKVLHQCYSPRAKRATNRKGQHSAIKDASDVLRASRSDGNANMLLIRMSYRRPP